MNNKVLFADRSERGKLRFTGEQRLWFLHQILTQAFEDMAPGDARDAAFITVHGRMRAFMECVTTEDAVLMHFERELAETLPDEIRRYVFATRVEVEDVTESMGLVLVVGDGWRELASRCAPEAVLHPTSSLGVEAGYVWVERASVDALVRALGDAGAGPTSETELEAIRIAHGAPRWGYEMDEKTFPQEAGIDGRAVHYNKGCYVGQEAMAKIHFRGRVNRRLASLTADSPLRPGAALSLDETKIGTVTSAAGDTALALVRYTIEAGTTVDAGGVTATIAS
jgi:folate-binding protein YgfZ